VPVDVARYFVTVRQRQVHYRRAGVGPPILMLHASTGASAGLLPLIELLAAQFTVIAPDTAGCGASSPLPVKEPEIDDYATATVELIDALGLQQVPLYGKHTGAKIALAVAARHPQRVSHLVLDGLSLATDDERSDLLARYAPPIEPVWHGGHLLALWHQVRNMSLFFPWHDQSAANRLDTDVASALTINSQVVDLLGGEADYRLPFAAGSRMDAIPLLHTIKAEATILVREGDPIQAQLSRLTPPPPGVQVAVLPRSIEPARAAAFEITRVVGARPAGGKAPPPAPVKDLPGAITRGYAPTTVGRLHVRRAGSDTGRPLVMLHASPGSAAGLEPLVIELARKRTVLAFDTLGHGHSDPPKSQSPDIGFYASSVVEALDNLQVGPIDLYGSHTGALIAIEIGLKLPDRIGRLVLDGIPIFSPDERDDLLANYTPFLRPVDDGTHLVRLWHMLRDMSLFWPWYRHTRAGIRPYDPPDPKALHKRMIDTVRALTTYHLAYRAAFRYPTRARLPMLTQPALMCAGPTDPLLPTLDEAAQLAPAAVKVRTAGTLGLNALTATVERFNRFLDG
jgi:pimeloyl-ACP methyl ester carboxylesterase